MSDVLHLLIDRVDTPIGELLLVADDAGNLRAIDWADYESRMLRLLRRHGAIFRPTLFMRRCRLERGAETSYAVSAK